MVIGHLSGDVLITPFEPNWNFPDMKMKMKLKERNFKTELNVPLIINEHEKWC